jgi:uncharacterized protein (DUF58 family)
MTTYFSRRYYHHLMLICVGIICGALFRRVEVLFLATPFLCAILLSFLIDSKPSFSVRHSISQSRLYEGDSLKVTIEVEAHSDIPIMELLDPLPDGAELGPGFSNLTLISLRAGQIQDFTYQLVVRHRGRFWVGELRARVHSPSEMIYRESRIDRRKSYTVYPGISFIRRSIRPAFTQTSVGNYTARRAGGGIEFETIRPYAPGDAFRRINWPRALRWGRLYVNEHLPERNSDIIIMIDSLANAGSAELNTLDLCVRGAASLAYSFMRRKDRVGLIDYGGIFRWVPPGMGVKHWHRLMDRLVEAEVAFSYVNKDLALVPKRILPPQSLVIALTPLLDERFIASLSDLTARGFNVAVIVPSPGDVLAKVMKPSRLNEAAALLWEMERKLLLDDLRRAGMGVVEWRLSEPMEVVAYKVADWQRKARARRSTTAR